VAPWSPSSAALRDITSTYQKSKETKLSMFLPEGRCGSLHTVDAR
jgi:hypothetical protein